MKIKRIELHNFRNFRDLDLDFSSDNPNKKITVILGDNTYGKTTLVKAFLWCLYREANFKTKSVLNKDVEDSLSPHQSATVKVILTLDHDNKRYQITTSETYTSREYSNGHYYVSVTEKAQTDVLVYENGISKGRLEGDSADETINSILPQELKDYFFFDGETNQIDTVVKKRNLGKAIDHLMNLNKYIHLRDYFDPNSTLSVVSELSKKLTKSPQAALLQLDENLKSAREELNKKKKEIEDYTKQIGSLKGEFAKCEAELDANKDIVDAQNKKKNYLERQEKNHNEIMKNFDQATKLFSGGPNSSSKFLNVLFAYSYSTGNIKNVLDASTFSYENSYRNITEKAVDDLIMRGYCLCGTEIKTGSDAYMHLIEAKQHMEPQDYGKYVADYRDHEDFNCRYYKDYVSQIKDKAYEVIQGAETEEAIVRGLKDISEKIVNNVDVGALQAKENKYHDEIIRLSAIVEKDNNDLPNLQKKVDEAERKQEIDAAKNKKNENVLRAIDYAKRIYHMADGLLKENANKVREDLTREVQTVFDSMYSGSRKITISRDYEVSTQTVDNNYSLDESTGLNTVINFSFVIGLTNLAKKAAKTKMYSGDFSAYESDKTEDEYEVYPLVLDAPFSSTDSRHIAKICHAISENCDQVIMFVMEKDFRHAENDIGNRIGRRYKLVKDSESEAHVEEVN